MQFMWHILTPKEKAQAFMLSLFSYAAFLPFPCTYLLSVIISVRFWGFLSWFFCFFFFVFLVFHAQKKAIDHLLRIQYWCFNSFMQCLAKGTQSVMLSIYMHVLYIHCIHKCQYVTQSFRQTCPFCCIYHFRCLLLWHSC